MISRCEAIDKIRKLRRLAESTPFSGEAETARRKADQMAAAHGIPESEIAEDAPVAQPRQAPPRQEQEESAWGGKKKATPSRTKSEWAAFVNGFYKDVLVEFIILAAAKQSLEEDLKRLDSYFTRCRIHDLGREVDSILGSEGPLTNGQWEQIRRLHAERDRLRKKLNRYADL